MLRIGKFVIQDTEALRRQTTIETHIWGNQLAAILVINRLSGVVASEVNLREYTLHVLLTLTLKPEKMSTEVQNRGISKMTCLHKNF